MKNICHLQKLRHWMKYAKLFYSGWRKRLVIHSDNHYLLAFVVFTCAPLMKLPLVASGNTSKMHWLSSKAERALKAQNGLKKKACIGDSYLCKKLNKTYNGEAFPREQQLREQKVLWCHGGCMLVPHVTVLLLYHSITLTTKRTWQQVKL